MILALVVSEEDYEQGIIGDDEIVIVAKNRDKIYVIADIDEIPNGFSRIPLVLSEKILLRVNTEWIVPENSYMGHERLKNSFEEIAESICNQEIVSVPTIIPGMMSSVRRKSLLEAKQERDRMRNRWAR